MSLQGETAKAVKPLLAPLAFIKLKIDRRRLKSQYPSLKEIDTSTGSHKSERLAIYSTYCGTTSKSTFNPARISSDYPHYFVSNNEDILSRALAVGYIPIYLNKEISNDDCISCAQGKIAKVMPHTIKCLSNYQFLFYKDDKIRINASRIDEFIKILQATESAIALRPHPFLSGNVLYEFGEAMHQARYKRQWDKTVSYITEELNNGAKLECQMYWCSAILRNMQHPDTIRINELWWQHINRCGIEDQVSFDIIAQKFDSIEKIPLNLE